MKAVLLAGMTICAVAAQSLTEPPPILRLYRFSGPASVRPYADARIPVNVIGLSAVTGRPETWLIEIHDSFAGIEGVDRSLHGTLSLGTTDEAGQPAEEILPAPRSVIAVYRASMSYRPEQAVQALRTARYFQVSIYRVNPGGESEFAEVVKSRRVLFDSTNLDRPDIAYYVASGAMSGTYLFLAPLPSLKVLDDALAKTLAYAETGAAESSKAKEFSRQHLLFRVEPAVSWVSDDFASADPAFWHPNAKKP